MQNKPKHISQINKSTNDLLNIIDSKRANPDNTTIITPTIFPLKDISGYISFFLLIIK
jgi:hypothetical protein